LLASSSVVIGHFTHVSHIHLVDKASIVSNDLRSLLSSNFGNLDFSLPVFDAVNQLLALVLLLHKLDWIGHILHQLLQTLLLSIHNVNLVDFLSGLRDGVIGFLLLLLFDLHLA